MGSVGSFLLSKEIIPLEHEFWTGVAVIGVVSMIISKVGPGVGEALEKEVDADVARLVSIRQDEIDR